MAALDGMEEEQRVSTVKQFREDHRDWVDALVLSLRAGGAPDARIAAELAQAHQRCEDAGQAPQELLGDPVDYVRSLGFRPRASGASAERTRRQTAAVAVPAAQAVLVLVGGWAVRAWVTGESLALHWLTLSAWAAALVVLVVFGILALRAPRTASRGAVFFPVFLLAAVLAAAGAVLSRLSMPVAAYLSPVPVALVLCGVVLLLAVGQTLWAVRRARRAGGSPFPLVLLGWLVPAWIAVDAAFTAMTLG